jgi:hypothetical protein
MTFGVDVSSEINKKEQMLAAHESQREWLKHINKWDAYIENMLEDTKTQGKAIGRNFGECFIQHVGNGHPRDNILKEILRDLVVDL